MPAPALHLLCADLGLIAYEPGFLTSPGTTALTGLAPLGRTLRSLVLGVDPGIGVVPFGFISDGPEGPICTLRGTQMPGRYKSLVEWLDDLDAFLEPCPFAAGAEWHRGFGRVYQTLNVGSVPLATILAQIPGILVHGHSLGGPLATYASGESRSRPPILFASPKPGDAALRQWLLGVWDNSPASYANPNDAVPRVPITVDFPWKIEDFELVTMPVELSPLSVEPPVPADWESSHSLTNYRRLLAAMP